MAQTGYTPILIYASGTTGNTPSASNLTSSASGAELALNYFDGKLFYKDASGNVQVLAGKGGSGVVAGSNTQVQFNNNGVFGASANMTFNGTRLTVADLADSGLTAGRVTYASTGGALVDSANLTFDGTTLTANSLTTTGTANFGGNVYLTTNATYYQSRTTGGTYIRMLGINSGNTAYVGPIDSGPVETILNASSSATNIQFYASGSEQMRLTSTGLGIGTTSPSGTNGAGYASRLTLAGTNTALNIKSASNTDFYIGATGGSLVFYDNLNSVERARIDSSGAFLVGKTSPTYTTDGTSFSSSGGSNFSFTSGAVIAVNRNGTNGSAIDFYKVGAAVGSISVTGSATAFNTSSDYRLKEDVQPMIGALAKVAQLKPCIYKWKADGSDGEGFIAHELAEVVPQCVTGEKDAVDADGNPQYQGIDTSFLVATLTAAIQELKAEFDAYKATHP